MAFFVLEVTFPIGDSKVPSRSIAIIRKGLLAISTSEDTEGTFSIIDFNFS